MEAAVPQEVFMLDDTFDQLVGAVAEKPDDELAVAALKEHFAAVHESGAVSEVMQMAMTLGAMACMGHEHLAGVANEMDALYGPREDRHAHSDHTHSHDHDLPTTSVKGRKKVSRKQERTTLSSLLFKILENRRASKKSL